MAVIQVRNKDVQDYSDGSGDGEVEWMEVAVREMGRLKHREVAV